MNASPAGEVDPQTLTRLDYSYAFQPIVDTRDRRVVAYEALIRGPRGQPAASVLGSVGAARRYDFDAECRVAAIEIAARLGIEGDLNLNFFPRSLFADDGAIASMVDAAGRCGLAIERLVVEVTEGEMIDDYARFAHLVNAYRGRGLKVAIDDFGAGYSGLNLLAEFQPDQIKIDIGLVRGIEGNGPRQAIVRALAGACLDLGIDVIAEGVETLGELRWLEAEGIRLFQGFLLARPGFEMLPAVAYPR